MTISSICKVHSTLFDRAVPMPNPNSSRALSASSPVFVPAGDQFFFEHDTRVCIKILNLLISFRCWNDWFFNGRSPLRILHILIFSSAPTSNSRSPFEDFNMLPFSQSPTLYNFAFFVQQAPRHTLSPQLQSQCGPQLSILGLMSSNHVNFNLFCFSFISIRSLLTKCFLPS